jgi:UDP-3-O-[3-hydroxymyristoyl] glucosamine N-acyltransferase
LVGGQVGVADHAVVGDCARLAGRAGVIGDVPAGQTFAGYPAVERMRWLRAIANLMRGRRL